MGEKRQNVQVCCRFRPENQLEKKQAGKAGLFQFSADHKAVSVSNEATGTNTPQAFAFDYVFSPDSDQIDVFNNTAKPLLSEIFKGFNVTIFAYGQTGSGKTHTMMGEIDSPEKRGIIPRLIESLFVGIENSSPNMEFTVKLSYVEIYMEKLHDLLDPLKTNLGLRESPEKGVYIDDATEIYVSSQEEVYHWMKEGGDNRAIAATRMNATSSRSHSVLIITLMQKDRQLGSKKSSKLVLVDLAGSEKVAKTEAAGLTLKEAQHINKSLTLLGIVIHALTENASHIPYRDSKLTRLLTDSLGGNSRTTLIVTASPSPYNLEETISTLRFGVRAKAIQNKAHINQELSIEEYKKQLAAAHKTIAEQKGVIEQLQGVVTSLSNGTYVFPVAVLEATSSDVPSFEPKAAGGGENTEESRPGGGGAASSTSSGMVVSAEEIHALRQKTEEQVKDLEELAELVLEKDAEVTEHKMLLKEKLSEIEELKEQMSKAKSEHQKQETMALELQTSVEDIRRREQEKVVTIGSLEKQMELLKQELDQLRQDLHDKSIEAATLRALSTESGGSSGVAAPSSSGSSGRSLTPRASDGSAGPSAAPPSPANAQGTQGKRMGSSLFSSFKIFTGGDKARLESENARLKTELDALKGNLSIEQERVEGLTECLAKAQSVHREHIVANESEVSALKQENAKLKHILQKISDDAAARTSRIRRQPLQQQQQQQHQTASAASNSASGSTSTSTSTSSSTSTSVGKADPDGLFLESALEAIEKWNLVAPNAGGATSAVVDEEDNTQKATASVIVGGGYRRKSIITPLRGGKKRAQSALGTLPASAAEAMAPMKFA